MKILIVVGIVLAILGGVIVFRGLSYISSHDEVRIGGFHASLKEKKAIPAWMGGVAIVGGVALIVAGARSKR